VTRRRKRLRPNEFRGELDGVIAVRRGGGARRRTRSPTPWIQDGVR